MGIFLISIFFLGFLIVPLFALAMCRSAGMADRRLEMMRSPITEPERSEMPVITHKKDQTDPSAEKTRPIFQRAPVSVE